MGTHPVFESDFDCLTDMSNREYGECTEIFIPAVPKKDHVPSELEKKIQKELKLVEKNDFSFKDQSYKGFKDDSKPNELNFDCPCVDNLPYGPCGPLWRKYMVEKEIEKLDDDVTMKSYRTWFECFSTNASVYMPEFLKTMEKKRAEAAADLDAKMNASEVKS